MKELTLIAKKREKTGKVVTKKLRTDGFVPCVMYGKEEHLNFYMPQISFKELLHTQDAHIVNLQVEDKTYKTILQEAQFHPIGDFPIHADFLEISDNKEAVIEVPIRTLGNAPGILKGGKLFIKLRKLKIKALPQYFPPHIDIDITKLELGDSIKVSDIKLDHVKILDTSNRAIISVNIPRLLKVQEEAAVATAVTAEAGATATGTTPGATTPAVPGATTATTPTAGIKPEKGKERKKEKGKDKGRGK